MVELVGTRALIAELHHSQNWLWRTSFRALRSLVVSIFIVCFLCDIMLNINWTLKLVITWLKAPLCHYMTATWKTFMIHQAFVRWAALYILFKFVKFNLSSDIWALPSEMSHVSDDFHEHWPDHDDLRPNWCSWAKNLSNQVPLADTAKTFGLLPDQGQIFVWFCWYQTGVLPVLLIFYQPVSEDW